MLFNSFAFCIFFPVVTILYFIAPHRHRWLLLLLVSCFFYMFFIPKYILVLILTIVVDYTAAIWIEKSTGRRKSLYMWVSVVSTCLILFIFKYYDFFILNYNELARLMGWNYSLTALHIILPIGLSFHTFQSLSYVIEVYRGNQKAEMHFGIYSLYVMYYPQLVAGPIERPQNLLHQFRSEKLFHFSNFYRGLRLMAFGFFLKLVVADRLALYVSSVYDQPEFTNGALLGAATLFFAFQVYADFAGYSSIAIGASRMMGIGLMTNFRRPYFSTSITEFWRRWHISLSTWLRDYLFTPLVIELRNWGQTGIIVSLLISFTIIGLWHGANWTYVFFGILHGTALSIELLTKNFRKQISKRINARVYALLSILITFSVYCMTLPYFRAVTIDQANQIVLTILTGPWSLAITPHFVFCAFVILTVVFYEVLYVALYRQRRVKLNRPLFSNLFVVAVITLILFIGVFNGDQFIYFQF